jgi:hypothetical protein
MSAEFSLEPAEPEQRQPSNWQRLRQWLGFSAVETGGQSPDLLTAAVEDDLRDENGNFSAEKINAVIERKEQERLDRLSPPGFPMPLEAGPQRYDTPPSFWAPDTDGVPLADYEPYQIAKRFLATLLPLDD